MFQEGIGVGTGVFGRGAHEMVSGGRTLGKEDKGGGDGRGLKSCCKVRVGRGERGLHRRGRLVSGGRGRAGQCLRGGHTQR